MENEIFDKTAFNKNSMIEFRKKHYRVLGVDFEARIFLIAYPDEDTLTWIKSSLCKMVDYEYSELNFKP